LSAAPPSCSPATTGSIRCSPYLIAALILWSSLSIVRETLNILLEGTPRGCSLAEIRVSLQAIDGVQDVHDLHVWSLGSQTHALATHITIADIPPSESARILEQVNGTLRQKFRIYHSTIQFECVDCEVAHGCAPPIEIDEHDHPGSRSLARSLPLTISCSHQQQSGSWPSTLR
jgi:cobalt-zinc-cadmium efflux system protein